MIPCKVQKSRVFIDIISLTTLFTQCHGRFLKFSLPPNLTLSAHAVFAVYFPPAFRLIMAVMYQLLRIYMI